MKFIEKYYKIVIIALLAVVFLQTCKSCSHNQELAFLEVEVKNTVDSLHSVIKSKDSIIIVREGEIRELKAINGALESNSEKTIDMLNRQNKHLVNKVAEKNIE